MASSPDQADGISAVTSIVEPGDASVLQCVSRSHQVSTCLYDTI